jgi:hypothetical protein
MRLNFDLDSAFPRRALYLLSWFRVVSHVTKGNLNQALKDLNDKAIIEP